MVDLFPFPQESVQMSEEKKPGCCAWIIWFSPVLLYCIWAFQSGYNEIKQKDWVGEPASVTSRVGAPRTLHQLPGAPPNKRIPYPFDPVWQTKIAPTLGGIMTGIVMPLILLLLWWLAKSLNSAHNRERYYDTGQSIPPWERFD